MWLVVIVLKSRTPDHKNYLPLLGETDKKEETKKNKNKQKKTPQKNNLLSPFITNFLKIFWKQFSVGKRSIHTVKLRSPNIFYFIQWTKKQLPWVF